MGDISGKAATPLAIDSPGKSAVTQAELTDTPGWGAGKCLPPHLVGGSSLRLESQSREMGFVHAGCPPNLSPRARSEGYKENDF